MTLVPWVEPAAADQVPLAAPDWQRLAAVPVNILSALGLYLCPVGLAVFYPENLHHSPAMLVAAPPLLAAISVLAWRCRASRPELLAGWGWFVALYLPSSGLLRAGQHALADATQSFFRRAQRERRE